MRVDIQGMGGIAPKITPRHLANNLAQVARNVLTIHGGLAALEAPSEVLTLPKAPPIQTIYRFGQALDDPTKFWFHFQGDVDVVKGAVAADTSERTYWTGEGAPKFTTNLLGTAGTIYPSSSRPLGITPPQSAPVLTLTNGPATGTAETRTYVYTFVNEFSDESAPSPPAVVPGVYTGASIAISGMETTSQNLTPLTKKRIYRAARGVLQLVAEIASTQTSFTDTVANDLLGYQLKSTLWDPPPDNLKGLTAAANGILAGFVGYDVYFSEAYRPYAWPTDYIETVDFPIVGLGAYGQTVVVLTTGLPYVISGSTPKNMSMQNVPLDQACVSKRSIASVGYGVIYASPDGLAFIGQGEARLLTKDIFSRTEWRKRNPESMMGIWFEGQYIGFYNDGSAIQGFTYTPERNEWIDIDVGATAAYADAVTDSLYLVIGNKLMRWRGGNPMVYTWESKPYSMFNSFSAGLIRGDGPAQLILSDNGEVFFNDTVDPLVPFRIPNRGRVRELEVKVVSTNRIQRVVVAGSMEELLGA